MNAEVKRKWVEALRSGKYRQGKNRLRNTKGEFCCLGVLCDIAEREGVMPPTDNIMPSGYVCYGKEQTTMTLPDEVIQWSGVPDSDPMIAPERTSLSALNDLRGLSFAAIADLIEKHL